ncbi:MAG: CocE/NonD family hydrolase, partial [Deltaproteobacteria bacterium]|nr:CocE/NonD family hydrolase [Deltaproteobacteria bacterium]
MKAKFFGSICLAAAIMLFGTALVAEDQAPYSFNIKEVFIPTLDGGKLSADIYTPGKGKYPTILIITQSPKARWRKEHFPRSAFCYSGDYAVVCVNTRGKGASASNPKRTGINPFGLDGYDVIEWVAKQPWSNGKVGMWGGSNEGKNQYATAQANPPHLNCIMPALTTTNTNEYGSIGRNYEQLYLGGVLRLELIQKARGNPLVKKIMDNPLHEDFYDYRPEGAPTVKDIKVPVMVIGAWFDNDVNRVSLRTFHNLIDAADEKLRKNHRIL